MLQSISVKHGLRMATAESKEDIPKFIEFFKASNEPRPLPNIYPVFCQRLTVC